MIGLTSEDVDKGRHYADLGEDGEFRADCLILNFEHGDINSPVESFEAYGAWKRHKGEEATPGIITVTEIDIDGETPTYRDIIEGYISPGQLFKVRWLDWTVKAVSGYYAEDQKAESHPAERCADPLRLIGEPTEEGGLSI